jgi:phosphoglycolate phosphatase-like HAD superfamily hydrolase
MSVANYRETQAVIWDADDTLWKTFQPKADQYIATGRRAFCMDVTIEQVRESWGLPYDTTLQTILRNVAPLEVLRRSKEALEKEFPVVVADGALELHRTLHEKGVAQTVLSSGSQKLIKADLDRLGFDLDRFFDIQCDVDKDDPNALEPMLQKLQEERGIVRPDVLFIADSLRDFRLAQSARVDFVGVTTGVHTPEDFAAVSATAVIPNLDELPEHLRLSA